MRAVELTLAFVIMAAEPIRTDGGQHYITLQNLYVRAD